MRSWGWFGMGVLMLFTADSARYGVGGGTDPAPAAPQPMVIVEFVPAKRPLNEQIPVASQLPSKTTPTPTPTPVVAAKHVDDPADDDTDDDDETADAPDDDVALEEDLGGHAGPPSERDISLRLGRMRGLLKKTKPAGGAATPTDEPDEKQATQGADDELRAIGKLTAKPAIEGKKQKDGKNGATLAEHESDGALPEAATRHRPLTTFQRKQ